MSNRHRSRGRRIVQRFIVVRAANGALVRRAVLTTTTNTATTRS
jgi:hypothetical protein